RQGGVSRKAAAPGLHREKRPAALLASGGMSCGLCAKGWADAIIARMANRRCSWDRLPWHRRRHWPDNCIRPQTSDVSVDSKTYSTCMALWRDVAGCAEVMKRLNAWSHSDDKSLPSPSIAPPPRDRDP